MREPRNEAGREPETAAGRMLDDLDEIDIAIVRVLQEQGRTPNAQIARRLGVSEPTVRKRVDRLFEENMIKVVAVLNPRKTGYATDVLIGIRVESGRMREVGQALSRFDQVVYLGYVTGRYDLLVEMLFRDDESLLHFLQDELPSLGGIVSTETYHVLRTEKINYDWELPSEFGMGVLASKPAESNARPTGKQRSNRRQRNPNRS